MSINVQAGLMDSISNFFSGKKAPTAAQQALENNANRDPEVELSEEEKEKLSRPLDAPDFEDQVDGNPFDSAYEEAAKNPESGEEDRDLLGEPANLVADTEDGQNKFHSDFDVDDFFRQLKNLDCSKSKPELNELEPNQELHDEDFNNLCESTIRSYMFSPMSKPDHHALDLYNFLQRLVYQPLGINMYPKFTFPEVLSDTIFMNDDNYLINKNVELPSNEAFYKDVSQSFKNIETYSNNFESNKDKISEQIIDVLKKFHIFWNVHRARNQMGSVQNNTVEIIHSLLNTFKRTSLMMKSSTVNILKSIKQGYFRFLRAYRMWQSIQDKPLEMLALQIIRRYKENVEKIRLHKSSDELQTTEIAYILDMQRAFFILNHKLKVQPGENVKRYEVAILKKIEYIYDTYRKYMLENGENAYEQVRAFTVTLMLKMQHRKYIVFELYSIQTYMNLPAFSIDNQYASAIKIYYLLMDALLLVPAQCKDLLLANLDNCATQKAYSTIENYYSQYQLFASVSGTDLLQFLRSGVKTILEDLETKHSFDKFEAFKAEYFSQLFRLSERYRQKYGIHDMKIIDELENSIGFEIEKVKSLHAVSKINYDLIDDLDRTLYEFFISVKTKYNQYGPLNNDLKILTLITKDLNKNIQAFRRENKVSVTSQIDSVFDDIENVCKVWLRDHSVHFIINAHTMNNESPFVEHLPENIPHSALVQAAMSNPYPASGLMSPVFQQEQNLINSGRNFDIDDSMRK